MAVLLYALWILLKALYTISNYAGNRISDREREKETNELFQLALCLYDLQVEYAAHIIVL